MVKIEAKFSQENGYYSGSRVSGEFTLQLNSTRVFKSITITVKGDTKVRWSEKVRLNNMNQTVYFESQENHIKKNLVVANETELTAGSHSFPFSIILAEDLPSTYEGANGVVRYRAKITLERSWKPNKKFSAPFRVITRFDLNLRDYAEKPLKGVEEKTVGMMCCTSGPLKITLSSPYSGFANGDTIPIEVNVENNTTHNVTSCVVALRQVVTFVATSPYENKRERKTVIAKEELGKVSARLSESWRKDLEFPFIIPSNSFSSKILKVHYEIKVKAKVSGMFTKGLNVKRLILIGTVPLRSRQNQ